MEIKFKIEQLSPSNLDYHEELIHENIETRKLFDAIYHHGVGVEAVIE
ncbi:hypothetical protein [Sphingobacterium sp. UBA1498]|nr:hypothetical protein [Sphingobacterium sp. UBA1498]